jgi:ribose-phosphate pyrophosphokinase
MEGIVILADSKGKGYGFAKGVCEYIMKKEGRQFPVIMADILRTEFVDGEYKLKISHNVRRKSVFFIHDSNKEPSKWITDLLFTLEAMSFSSPEEVNVVFPYTRFARQDRKDESRVSVNVKAIADLVSLYADRGMTMDLHVPQIQEFFEIPFDNLKSAPVLVNYLLEKHSGILTNLVIVSPDAGGGKRVEELQKALMNKGVNAGIAICYKKRSRDNQVDEIKVMGDIEGKNCLILDDIIDTGNTLVKTCEELKKVGAKRVLAYGTHGLFSRGTEKFTCFDKLIISDTMFNNPSEKVDILSTVGLFGEAIYRTYRGESLSVLFSQ